MKNKIIVPSWFLSQRHKAVEENLGEYDYNLYAAEFNPGIVSFFCHKFMKPFETVWEPFAGQKEKCDSVDICKSFGLNIIAYDIDPKDERVTKADSTVEGPNRDIHGVIFHPPYFGSSELSQEDNEISKEKEFESYLEKIKKTTELINENMGHGYICIVARTIFTGGNKYPLDWIFTEMFFDKGFVVYDMIKSNPDSVIILHR